MGIPIAALALVAFLSSGAAAPTAGVGAAQRPVGRRAGWRPPSPEAATGHGAATEARVGTATLGLSSTPLVVDGKIESIDGSSLWIRSRRELTTVWVTPSTRLLARAGAAATLALRPGENVRASYDASHLAKTIEIHPAPKSKAHARHAGKRARRRHAPARAGG